MTQAARIALVVAILIDAFIAFAILSGDIFNEGQGMTPAIASAVAFAFLVAVLALGILISPRPIFFAAARGMAVVAGVCVLGFLFLLFIASSFENNGSSAGSFYLTLFAAFLLQAAIWALTIPVEPGTVSRAIATSIPGAFGFWAVSLVVIFGARMAVALIP